MAYRQPFNPNTKYGRRRIREDFQRRYNAKSPEEKKDFDNSVAFGRFILFVVAMAVCLIIVLLGGKIK